MKNLNFDIYNEAYDMLKKGLSEWIVHRLIRFHYLEVDEKIRTLSINEAIREFELV
jgi:hypothetical protein